MIGINVAGYGETLIVSMKQPFSLNSYICWFRLDVNLSIPENTVFSRVKENKVRICLKETTNSEDFRPSDLETITLSTTI